MLSWLCVSDHLDIKATSVCPTRQFLATTQGGHLSSPNYPSNYENNLNCKFTLLVPDGKKTHIEFIELKIECKFLHVFWQYSVL